MNGNLYLNRNLLERGLPAFGWAGSSAWFGALTLRIERPPYTRKPSHEGVGSGVQISPGPPSSSTFDWSSFFVSATHVLLAICFERASRTWAGTIPPPRRLAFESESAIPSPHR